MKDQYQKSVELFAKVYAKMHTAFTGYIEKNGGIVDAENGAITGLTEGVLIHVQQRNEQLNALLEYHTTAEMYIQRLENTIKRLDIENNLLQKGRSGETYSNAKVLKEIDFYMSYEVVEDTSIDDFTDCLRQTKFFIELALKRKILDPFTPEQQSKLRWANIFLDDTAMMKQFFNNKKARLADIAPVIENAINTNA